MYKKMLEDAKTKGITSEKLMWESVDDLEDMLCIMKKEHPEKYWAFIRRQHGLMYNNHYTEDFAMWDVEQMKPLGMYWSKNQIEEATKGMAFPSGTTVCDKFVAFNAFANDLKPSLTDEQVLKSAFAFWFDDKDWKGKNKIWEYMALNYSMK
jgi:hypothetical protein